MMIAMVLSVNSLDYDNRTILKVWELGEDKPFHVNPPFKPYFYSLKAWSGASSCKKTLLSTMDERWLWKVEFNTERQMQLARKPFTIEDRFSLVFRIIMEQGFNRLKQTPKMMSWDVETYVDGVAPNPFKDKLRSIGFYVNQRVNGCETNDPYTKDGERRLIKWFVKQIQDYDPDIIADFYGRFYDFRCLISRAHVLGVSLRVGRDGSEPHIFAKEIERRGRIRTDIRVGINGRCHFDVHREAEGDYSLTLAGVSTGLNSVSAHFAKIKGFEPPIADVNHGEIPLSRLAEVNIDDCRVTQEVAQIYLEPIMFLCDYLKAPLDSMINRSPSHIPTLVLGREYFKLGIVSDGVAKDRYSWVFSKPKACQGAFTKAFKYGLFRNITHSDYKSLYPSIMECFNLSAETVSLVELKPYTGKYRFVDRGDHAIIEVPDEYHGQVICRVRLDIDGVCRKLQRELKRRRSETVLKSHNLGLKVIANSVYGYNIMPYADYANPLVSILTTAIGRFIIENSIKGKDVIELDTDGFYYN